MRARTSLSRGRAALAVLAVLLFLPGAAAAQTAELRGSVNDASGSALPGVTVTITNSATGVERVVVTDQQGAFRAPALQPGPYTVESTLTGFSPDTKKIVLTVGQVADVKVSLEIGAIAETVQVVGRSAVEIETISTTSSRELASPGTPEAMAARCCEGVTDSIRAAIDPGSTFGATS